MISGPALFRSPLARRLGPGRPGPGAEGPRGTQGPTPPVSSRLGYDLRHL